MSQTGLHDWIFLFTVSLGDGISHAFFHLHEDEKLQNESQQHMYVPNPLRKDHGCEIEREGDPHLQNLTKGTIDVWSEMSIGVG